MRRKIKTCIILMIFMLSCCGCQKKHQAMQELEEIAPKQSEIAEKEERKEEKMIYVYVCGAVIQTGVYELPQDSRVYEVIEKAGGLPRMRIFLGLIRLHFCRMRSRFTYQQ